MYTPHEHNVPRHGTSKYVSCVTSAGLGPVAGRIADNRPYDLVSYLVKVKDLKIMSWQRNFDPLGK